MNLTFQVDNKLLARAVEALEQLAADYASVHRAALDRFQDMDSRGGRTYYQDDRAIVAEEQKQRAQREAMEDL